MKQALTAFLVIAVVVLAFLVGSYKTEITRQQKEKAELEMELIEQKYYKDEEGKLDACLAQAEKEHWDTWKLNCEGRGSDIKKNEQGDIESCSLPSDLAQRIKDSTQTEKDNCFRRYGK